MNFVMSLSINKRYEVVYNSILMIIDKCIKMIKYISIIKTINIAKLTKMFFEKIVLRFNMSDDIMSNKEFIFINTF